jgi:hypothetical protein
MIKDHLDGRDRITHRGRPLLRDLLRGERGDGLEQTVPTAEMAQDRLHTDLGPLCDLAQNDLQ